MIGRSNPNRLRSKLPYAALAILAGAAACQSEGEPDPVPPTPATSAPAGGEPIPSCEVKVEEVAGRTATLHLATENMQGQFYRPESVDWVYGDGETENVLLREQNDYRQEYTYPAAGEFEVNAFILMDAQEGVAPPWGKGAVPCDQATVIVK